MLVEMMSEEFVSAGQKRGAISFHSGLNTVLGGRQSDNSIGKSTFLLAVDFCFGGDAYYTETDLRTRFADVHHTIKFAFEFDGKKYRFSRNIVTPTEVAMCDENYNPVEVIAIKDFRALLLEHYHIDRPSLSFRDAVGRYMRIYGKDNYSEKLPLQADSKESQSKGIVALEKLFNYYTQIEQYRTESEKREAKKKAFNDAKKHDVLPVYVPTAKQAKANEKEIARLEEELQRISDTTDADMTDEVRENADTIIAIKSQITLLRRKRSKLVSQQNTIRINTDDTMLTDADFRALSEFFPEVQMQKLSEVEHFHHKIRAILQEEMSEEMDRLQALVDALDNEISDLEAQQRQLGVPVTLPKKFLQKHTELTRRIAVLKSQNAARESSQTLVAEVKAAKQALVDVEKEVLTLISSTINEQMRRYNDYLYTDERLAPVIEFTSGSKYTFHTPEDGGMGTGYKSMIVFDLSVLKLTTLPALIHDSLMFNHIGYEPLEKIMELYIQSGKQIFIAYDKQQAPTKRMQEILDGSTVIRLSEGGNELFGYSWAKKKNIPQTNN